MGVWIEQNLSLVLSGFVGLASFLILLFTYLKDLESTRRLDKFEIAIDALHDEIYKIQKYIKRIEGEQEERALEIQSQVETQARDMIAHSLSQTFEHLENIEQRVNDEIRLATDNLNSLDGKIRDLEFFSSSATSVDEKKISTLLQEGKSVDEISRELSIPRGEIELFLQLSDIAYKGR